ncbi:ferrochelatase [Lonepinella sp. BR2357]|uniref:ferrochelatase n=1 Tax=Lonepinella sp. BR2357 TaxID=3434549 RepID=UPI003F6E0497
MNKKVGVLLANLGTPDAPTAQAIKPYLRQFLSDPRVVDLPKWRWWPILNGLILPKRSKRVAKNYQAVWTAQGSPLLATSLQQKQALQDYFTDKNQNIIVELGMTYGNPSMQSAVQKLTDLKVEKIIVLPLYPQYSSTTTASVLDAFAQALKSQRHIVPFEFIHSYHLDEHYINALANSIRAQMQEDDFLLFSYHGIPVRYEQRGDYYPEHCRQTTLAVVDKLGLVETQWNMTFQSRFGKEEWLQPYTDEFMQTAAKNGIEKLAVICPGFSADCLETLEEIDQENRGYFLENGGKRYQYIPALNANKAHIEMMANLVIRRLAHD